MAPRTGHRLDRTPSALRILRQVVLGVPFAVALALAGPVLAQDVIGSVTVETTEGAFLVALEEENADVRDHARAFANLVSDRVFFHRSDKQIICDDTFCTFCFCNGVGGAEGLCFIDEGLTMQDPNERTCTEDEYLVNDQLEPSAVLHAGLLDVDEGNHLHEVGASLDTALQSTAGVFSNTAMTVAFVRVGKVLTAEWIVNVEDNSDLVRSDGLTFDDADNAGAQAHLVFGVVTAGQQVVLSLAGLPTTDARDDPSLLADGTSSSIRDELEQLPITSFEVEPLPDLVTFCDRDNPDPDCLEPLCTTVADDELRCEEPRCYALIPLEDGADPDSERRCANPEQPNFPLIISSTPSGLTLLNNGLAPPEPSNVLDYPNNPGLTIDVRDEDCPDNPADPLGACSTGGGVPTVLQVTTGGSAGLLRVSDGSLARVDDGSVEGLELYDETRTEIAGGVVTSVTTTGTSDASLEGGAVTDWLADGDATALVSGGSLDDVEARGASLVRIVGSDFSESLGPIVPTSGMLTGTLASGDSLTATFAQGEGSGGTATGVVYLLSDADLPPDTDFVPVLDPGNTADSTGLGAVSYPFAIGQREVTNAEYTTFLNAAALSDPHDLYDSDMETDDVGGILRTGGFGNYRYETKAGRAEQPVVFVSRLDAIRYANWLHNGRPAGVGDAATEDGAYTFSDETTVGGRNPEARFFVPTQDEWYKAAHYAASGATYFLYPTSSDTFPDAVLPGRDVGNAANLADAVGNASNPLTDAGRYAFSSSPSGSLDQAGNVREWLEDSLDLRGGSWDTPVSESSSQETDSVASELSQLNDVGFRVPEPSSHWLALSALGTLLGLRRHRRRASRTERRSAL
jgi:formylglycine-generating enzyme required for sulfatase activity